MSKNIYSEQKTLYKQTGEQQGKASNLQKTSRVCPFSNPHNLQQHHHQLPPTPVYAPDFSSWHHHSSAVSGSINRSISLMPRTPQQWWVVMAEEVSLGYFILTHLLLCHPLISCEGFNSGLLYLTMVKMHVMPF